MSRRTPLPPPDMSGATNVLARRFSVDDDDRPRRRPAASPEPTSVDPKLVARNPFNRRRIDPKSSEVIDLADSLENGQIQAATVVHREAFLRIFGDHEDTIGATLYVLLAGEMRWTACKLRGLELEIAVRDQFADSAARWKAATAVENLKRTDLDLIEEAESVRDVVEACEGNQSAAARELGVERSWVAQRMAMLKLAPSAKEIVRQYKVPEREIRGSLHRQSEAEQLAYLDRLIRMKDAAVTAVTAEPGEQPVPAQRKEAARVTPVERAVMRLHQLPPEKRGELLRAQLTEDERRAWAADLLDGLS